MQCVPHESHVQGSFNNASSLLPRAFHPSGGALWNVGSWWWIEKSCGRLNEAFYVAGTRCNGTPRDRDHIISDRKVYSISFIDALFGFINSTSAWVVEYIPAHER